VMHEEAARRVLLVQSIEETDPDGRLLTLDERRRATAAARETSREPPEVLLERRATRLLDVLAPQAAWVGPLLGSTRFPMAAAWLIPMVAVAVGLMTDALGPERRINILSIPLLGLIVWNVAVYAVMSILWIARSARPRREIGRGAVERESRAPGLWTWVVSAAAEWRARRPLGPRARTSTQVAAVTTSYLSRWRRVAGALFATRVRLLLHLGAALLAVGVLAGAYGRGIAFEYQATWESTFLGPGAVRRLLAILLSPASALLGDPIPDRSTIAALRAPAAGEAAPWVHRYALTTLLIVVVPRALLAAGALRRSRRLAASLPVDLHSPYFLRLTAGGRALARVEVQPYGIRLEARKEATVERMLHELAGDAAEVRVLPIVTYGTDGDDAPGAGPDGASAAGRDGLESWRALVFSLAQTPEAEVHGAVLRRLVGWVGHDDRGRRRGLAVVDASSYRARLSGTGTETQRLAERRRAWDQVAHAAGVDLVHLDLENDGTSTDALDALERGVWPPRTSA
jgi:Protein of unknown function (DUF2868)